MSKIKWLKNLFSAPDESESDYNLPYRLPNIFEVSERAFSIHSHQCFPPITFSHEALFQSRPFPSMWMRPPDAIGMSFTWIVGRCMSGNSLSCVVGIS